MERLVRSGVFLVANLHHANQSHFLAIDSVALRRVALKESDRCGVSWFAVAHQFSKERHMGNPWGTWNAAVIHSGGGRLSGAMAPKREMQGKLFRSGEKGAQVRIPL
jgi:hypothetical protein